MATTISILCPGQLTREEERDLMLKPDLIPDDMFVMVGDRLMHMRTLYETMGQLLHEPIVEEEGTGV